MTPSQIAQFIPVAVALKRSVFIKGPVGVGKSDLMAQIARSMKGELRDVRMSQMDPTDIKGFPSPDAKNNLMRWLPPDFLPRDPKSKGLLFLDELTSAPTAVQAAAYQLKLDRKVGDYELPAGWGVVSAGNREIDRSITNRMPAALANRMVHVDYEVNLTDWVSWAQRNGISDTTVAFLRFREGLLHNFVPDSKESAFPSPRTWAMLDDFAQSKLPADLRLPVYSGCVGSGAAAEYLGFAQVRSSVPSIDQIALAPDKTPVPEGVSAQYAVTTMLSMATNTLSGFRATWPYVLRLPTEFQVVYVRDMMGKTDKVDIRSTKEFTAWGVANQAVIL